MADSTRPRRETLMADARSISAGELADRLGGRLVGDASRVIYEVATLNEAGADALSWVGRPDLLPQAEQSDAGVVLLPEGCSLSGEQTAICVTDPDAAVCDVLEYLAPPIDRVPSGVHPSATVIDGAVIDGASVGANVFVGRGARVGAGTQLYPGVYVGADTTIGRDCVLWPGVVVRERVTIGQRVIVHPNSTIGADGFGYLQRGGGHRKIPQIGTVVVEDDVEIGAGCAVDRARSGETRIGRGTKIDNMVQVAHNVLIGEHCIIIAQSALGGSTTLGRQVMLAGQSCVSDHRTIGDGVQIAAKTIVLRDVADGQVVRGNPATDHHKFLRTQAAARKVPKLLEQVRALSERVARLEAERHRES